MPQLNRTIKLAIAFVLCGVALPVYGDLNFIAAPRAQQHAPIAEQCRADLAVWYSYGVALEYAWAETEKLRNGTPDRTEINKLFLPEINARQREMGECMPVDTSRRDDYFTALTFYRSIADNREHSFLVRHDLLAQLMREDADGER